ncbi:hypothetical protein [Legionella worsleiensis]|uniref:Uncharacterized protein n=1 Tax=Legionella worsleiensis TaxID=45076 RepID=A0A0W1AJH5_9GAMM|nr:hypothetical protein [Legionella worsleiensis]KTD81483.1 hypothetical protein Lwor_0521 [Legionella worsleiensis]STY32042.1 Uncharacterised protein [Legionella worsleiensis]
MTQRLVWNFEFSANNPVLLSDDAADDQSDVKWERRFFWTEQEIIHLTCIDQALLDLANYQQKHKEDTYYILPDSNLNIKLRRNELWYKPILKETASATGFGTKINLDALHNMPDKGNHLAVDYLNSIAQNARKKGIEVFVKKEAFIYKFHTTPHIKLELARLEVNQNIYFSACIEGKSLSLVEYISEQMLGKQTSCEYVLFLKSILKS